MQKICFLHLRTHILIKDLCITFRLGLQLRKSLLLKGPRWYNLFFAGRTSVRIVYNVPDKERRWIICKNKYCFYISVEVVLSHVVSETVYVLVSTCLRGLQAIANKFIYILSFMDKCIFLLLDSIFLSETEGYTFCTCPLTVPRKPLWLQLWSTLHVWRNWYFSNSSYSFGVYSFVTRSDSSEINGIINVLTIEFVAFKKDTTFSTSATKKSWKQNICVVSLLDSVILFLRQFWHRSMFWHSFTHCREVTISLCRGLPRVQKYVWSYFYCGCTTEERWTQSYDLLCLTYTFLFQALGIFWNYWTLSIHISETRSSIACREAW